MNAKNTIFPYLTAEQGPHKDGWHATRQFYEWVYATRQFQAIPIVVKN